MAIYTGVDGVMRGLKGVSIRQSYTDNEIPVMKCGVEGVVRDLLNIADMIDHAEIRLSYVMVDKVDSNGEYEDFEGSGLTVFRQYGELEVGSNYVQITCTTSRKQLYLSYDIRVVYKDGAKAYLGDVLGNAGATYTLSVTGYEYFSTDGWYKNYCLGREVISGYVSGSGSNTVSFTDVLGQTGGFMTTALKYSGTSRSKQTFNNIRINGINVPITILNEIS